MVSAVHRGEGDIIVGYSKKNKGKTK